MNKPKTLLGFVAIVLALLVAACGGNGENGDETDTSDAGGTSGGAEVVMRNISFQPDEITVPAGTEVTWTNEDGVTHTATSDDTLWDSGELSNGESFSHTFEEGGTYTYTCQIHPSMEATITVEG